MVGQHFDRLVGQLVERLGLPVVLKSRAVAGIEQGLHDCVRHRLDEVDDRRAEVAQRTQGLLAGALLAGVADDRPHDRPTVQARGNERLRRRAEEGEGAPELVRR